VNVFEQKKVKIMKWMEFCGKWSGGSAACLKNRV